MPFRQVGRISAVANVIQLRNKSLQLLIDAVIRRIGKPEDQAKAIMFFATDDSEWVTGQLLEVSGGYGLGAPTWGDDLGG